MQIKSIYIAMIAFMKFLIHLSAKLVGNIRRKICALLSGNCLIYTFTVSLNEGKEVINIMGHVFVYSVHSYAGICMRCSLAFDVAD